MQYCAELCSRRMDDASVYVNVNTDLELHPVHSVYGFPCEPITTTYDILLLFARSSVQLEDLGNQ